MGTKNLRGTASVLRVFPSSNRQEATCPVVDLHPDGNLLVNEGNAIFAGPHGPVNLALAAAWVGLTHKEFCELMKNATEIVAAKIPVTAPRRGYQDNFQTDGYIVKLAAEDAAKLCCDLSFVDFTERLGQGIGNDTIVDRMEGVIAVTGSAMNVYFNATKKVDITIGVKNVRPYDAYPWFAAASYVQTNGPVHRTRRLNSGAILESDGFPSSNQRVEAIQAEVGDFAASSVLNQIQGTKVTEAQPRRRQFQTV